MGDGRINVPGFWRHLLQMQSLFIHALVFMLMNSKLVYPLWSWWIMPVSDCVTAKFSLFIRPIHAGVSSSFLHSILFYGYSRFLDGTCKHHSASFTVKRLWRIQQQWRTTIEWPTSHPILSLSLSLIASLLLPALVYSCCHEHVDALGLPSISYWDIQESIADNIDHEPGTSCWNTHTSTLSLYSPGIFWQHWTRVDDLPMSHCNLWFYYQKGRFAQLMMMMMAAVVVAVSFCEEYGYPR